MMEPSENLNLDTNDQIRLLMNLREDVRVLLSSHPEGIWFRMLPKVFYMHFHHDIPLEPFAIRNPLLFLDYISDIIKFDLPENPNDEDFIIELNANQNHILSSSVQSKDLMTRREMLFTMIQNANFQRRGPILREICIINEHLKHLNAELETAPVRQVPNQDHVALRLQKLRSMADFCLRIILREPEKISDDELINLYDDSDEFIRNLTPLAQRLSLTTK